MGGNEMSSTHVQKECEKWIVDSWLPKMYGVPFMKQRLVMQGRGVFEFDAVSTDMKIIGNISTATAFTYRGSVASGKKSKLRADCLMLALGSAETKLLILTETCMHELALKEQSEGRLPLDIEFCLVELPDYLKQKLTASHDEASLEVRGGSQ
jgi:hypothetical protein